MEKGCRKIEKLELKRLSEHMALDKKALDDLGKQFAKRLRGSEIVLFFGDLGSGKTTFIRSILSYFNVPEDEVRSPTFNIVNNYSTDTLDFYHIDAYRISAEELFEIGFYDYQQEDSIIFIEWAEKIITDLDGADFLIKLSIDANDIQKRNIIIYGKE
ncbi:MAG TPA: tRNA (adenosine(37)-N6)-threonylcarbamoyltransferase complex ATPase subunit type 1 TsaE [Thermotogota bacterium]|nr:tRNA (adenosine(37)-N6)-threonylcarbamoyltransferase complex ATPase subunit type 1 TsaE [Thermotogota bacterium]HPJ87615.1 tRNA (adenosine(37)-N6)-threonylcarbamoyltransferase complex ATPase subunit type 1 TsaE [Thermotogota bacterium]HPR94820.1 tRNA (adenosine(37)-N6)-threonylcarbamoyltransferase complex ATPase subunit type 1 TsaE [Thermotogota bacterium]